MSSTEKATAHTYLNLFRPDEVEAIITLVGVIRAHKESFIQQWRELYASMFDGEHGGPEQLFKETYVPYLRSGAALGER